MAKPKKGSGKRFQKLRNKLAQNPKIYDPDAAAAAIGRKKYGKKEMAEMAAAGRRRKARARKKQK